MNRKLKRHAKLISRVAIGSVSAIQINDHVDNTEKRKSIFYEKSGESPTVENIAEPPDKTGLADAVHWKTRDFGGGNNASWSGPVSPDSWNNFSDSLYSPNLSNLMLFNNKQILVNGTGWIVEVGYIDGFLIVIKSSCSFNITNPSYAYTYIISIDTADFSQEVIGRVTTEFDGSVHLDNLDGGVTSSGPHPIGATDVLGGQNAAETGETKDCHCRFDGDNNTVSLMTGIVFDYETQDDHADESKRQVSSVVDTVIRLKKVIDDTKKTRIIVGNSEAEFDNKNILTTSSYSASNDYNDIISSDVSVAFNHFADQSVYSYQEAARSYNIVDIEGDDIAWHSNINNAELPFDFSGGENAVISSNTDNAFLSRFPITVVDGGFRVEYYDPLIVDPYSVDGLANGDVIHLKWTRDRYDGADNFIDSVLQVVAPPLFRHKLQDRRNVSGSASVKITMSASSILLMYSFVDGNREFIRGKSDLVDNSTTYNESFNHTDASVYRVTFNPPSFIGGYSSVTVADRAELMAIKDEFIAFMAIKLPPDMGSVVTQNGSVSAIIGYDSGVVLGPLEGKEILPLVDYSNRYTWGLDQEFLDDNGGLSPNYEYQFITGIRDIKFYSTGNISGDAPLDAGLSTHSLTGLVEEDSAVMTRCINNNSVYDDARVGLSEASALAWMDDAEITYLDIDDWPFSYRAVRGLVNLSVDNRTTSEVGYISMHSTSGAVNELMSNKAVKSTLSSGDLYNKGVVSLFGVGGKLLLGGETLDTKSYFIDGISLAHTDKVSGAHTDNTIKVIDDSYSRVRPSSYYAGLSFRLKIKGEINAWLYSNYTYPRASIELDYATQPQNNLYIGDVLGSVTQSLSAISVVDGSGNLSSINVSSQTETKKSGTYKTVAIGYVC